MQYTNKDWKELLKHFNISNAEFAKIIGAKETTVKIGVSDKCKYGMPKWAKSAMWVLNRMKEMQSDKEDVLEEIKQKLNNR